MSVTNLSDESSYDRLCMLEAGARMVAERPLFGIGPNMVERLYPIYRHATASRLNVPHLHDSYAQLAAERGLPALASYLALLAVALARAWRGYRADLAAGHGAGEAGSRADLWLGVTAALVALSVAGLFEHNWGDTEVQRVALMLLAAPFCLRIGSRRCGRRDPAGSGGGGQMSAGSGPTEGARFARFLAETRAAVDGELGRLLPASGSRSPGACTRRCATASSRAASGCGRRWSLLAGRSFGAPLPDLLRRRRGGRADPHLQPDSRRPAGARRRRPAPRPADAAPRSSTRRRPSWPATPC